MAGKYTHQNFLNFIHLVMYNITYNERRYLKTKGNDCIGRAERNFFSFLVIPGNSSTFFNLAMSCYEL